MEASALHAPAGLSRFPRGGGLLRLRSDEQLVAAFRSGNDEAFRVIHDRYRQRLFAYVRQMLASCSRQDAEDVLQDVFVRAYGALRNDNREMNVRAWLYRVAHNRCIDHLRRPVPPAAEIFEVSRKPLHDPVEEAQRREDLRRLVADVGNLPEQQRSALLMREMDGMTYADLANALDVTVPAVKSLLVRARVGLVEAQEARDADCTEIQADLLRAYDRGVKASGRARKHMRSCDGCTEYRTALRGDAALVRRAGARRRRPAGAGREGPRSVRRRRCRGGRRGRRRRWRGRGGRRHRGRDRAARSPRSSAPRRSPPAARSRSSTRSPTARRRPPAEKPAAKKRTAVAAKVTPPVVAEPGGRPQVQTARSRRARWPSRRPRRAQGKTAVADKPRKLKPVRRAAVAGRGARGAAAPAATPDPQLETGGARAPDAPPAATPIPSSRRRADAPAPDCRPPSRRPAPAAAAAGTRPQPVPRGAPARRRTPAPPPAPGTRR